MRPTPLAIATLSLVAAATTLIPTRSGAFSSSHASTMCRSSNTAKQAGLTDFDGDGTSDLAVGAPGASGSRGDVEVRWSFGNHHTALRPGQDGIPGPALTSRSFGNVLGTINANNDGCTDLAIGLPNLTVDGLAAAGGVQIMLGTSDRAFASGPLLTRATPGVFGDPVVNEHFGRSVAGAHSGDTPELWVGVPGATVTVTNPETATLPGAGQVLRLRFDSRGDLTLDRHATENTQVFDGVNPEAGAQFGTSVEVDQGYEPDGDAGAQEAGCISFPSNAAGKLCGVQANEQFGASTSIDLDNEGGHGNTSHLLVGAPGHVVDGLENAGGVYDFPVSAHLVHDANAGFPALTEDTHGVPGKAEAGDRFGASLATTAVNSPGGKLPDLFAVGAPGEGTGKADRAGLVFVAPITNGQPITKLRSWQLLHLGGEASVPQSESGDHFGAALKISRVRRHDQNRIVVIVGAPQDRAKGAADVGSITVFPTNHREAIAKQASYLRGINGSRPSRSFGAAIAPAVAVD